MSLADVTHTCFLLVGLWCSLLLLAAAVPAVDLYRGRRWCFIVNDGAWSPSPSRSSSCCCSSLLVMLHAVFPPVARHPFLHVPPPGSQVIFATNRKKDLDMALLSRCSVVLPFELPNHEARSAIWRLFAKQLTPEEVATVVHVFSLCLPSL